LLSIYGHSLKITTFESYSSSDIVNNEKVILISDVFSKPDTTQEIMVRYLLEACPKIKILTISSDNGHYEVENESIFPCKYEENNSKGLDDSMKKKLLQKITEIFPRRSFCEQLFEIFQRPSINFFCHSFNALLYVCTHVNLL
jgi:hypothetical protein